MIGKIKTNINKEKIMYVIFAILIAYFLSFIGDYITFNDRLGYYSYASNSSLILKNNSNIGLIRLLANEPLFLIINSFLAVFFSPQNVLKVIIFCSTLLFFYSLGLMSKFNLLLIVVLLISPTVLSKYITHLRQGFAMSIYFLGIAYKMQDNRLKYIRFLAVFIHSSLYFLILYEILDLFFKKIKIDNTLKIIFSTIILTIFMGLIPWVSYIINDRRSNTYDYDIGFSGSGYGFLIWLVAGSFFLIYNKKNFLNKFTNYGIIFYLISYFYLDYGARIFESIFPLIILSTMINKNKVFKSIYLIFIFLFSALGWYLRGGFNF
jgi:hypothetical protein